ncbi:hypothetical protein MBLNU459_g7061t1 [Dothideomycetes sp. NU459]
MPLAVPLYKELPIRSDAPAGSSWGVFDTVDQRDVYGTLNFITREAVVAAKNEIQTGESVVLNLPLHLPYNTCSPRIQTEHKLLDKMFGLYCCDDQINLNTQSSSQWDGLLHFANQDRQEYYNGVKYAFNPYLNGAGSSEEVSYSTLYDMQKPKESNTTL